MYFLSEILNTVTNCASLFTWNYIYIVKMHVFVVPSHPKNCDIIGLITISLDEEN